MFFNNHNKCLEFHSVMGQRCPTLGCHSVVGDVVGCNSVMGQRCPTLERSVGSLLINMSRALITTFFNWFCDTF
jgi:flagellar motor component MotA